MTNTSANTINLAIGDRLVPTNNLLTVYNDPLAQSPAGSSITSNSTTGRATAYVQDRRFDYIVAVPSWPSRLFRDQEGAFIKSPPSWINVLDYATLQEAIDAVPADGGVVYIPGRQTPYSTTSSPSYTPPLNLPPDRAVHLLGDGPFRTYLQSANADVDMISMGGDHQTVEGIHLLGAAAPGPGRGIVIWRTGDYNIPHQNDVATTLMYRTVVRNCRIQDTPSYGLYIDDALRNGKEQGAVWGFYDNIEIRENNRDGCVYIAAGKTTTQYFKNCNFKNFVGFGVRILNTSGVSLIDCIIENQFPDAPHAYVSIETSTAVLLHHCWFEGKALPASGEPGQFFVETSGFAPRGVTVSACRFVRSTFGSQTSVNPKVMKVGSGSRSVTLIAPNILVAGGVPAAGDNHIEIDPDSEAVIIGGDLSDSVSVQSPRVRDRGGTSGESASMLINSMRRLRLPRLTTIQRDSLTDLEAGDMIWVSDPLTSVQWLQVWVGDRWMAAQLLEVP